MNSQAPHNIDRSRNKNQELKRSLNKENSDKYEEESIETSESLKLLAHKILEVGSLFGVKVIDNEETALKRVTRSLNKKKKTVRQRNRN